MLQMIMVGHLGGDATSELINGKTVIKFSCAHTHSYKNQQGQKIDSTTWVRCEYWVTNNNLTQYLKKGTLVFLSGMPKVWAFKREDNTIAASQQLRVTDLQLLGSKKDSSSGPSSAEMPDQVNTAGSQPPIPNAADITEPIDDLPF